MRKLVYATSLSLDGYIDAEAGDPSWVVPDEELHRHFNEIERETDTLLYGRRMYELMAGYWPTADQDPSAPAVIVEYAQLWKPIPKVVFSSTLESVDWNSLL
jgi:dihydrofolate reductase